MTMVIHWFPSLLFLASSPHFSLTHPAHPLSFLRHLDPPPPPGKLMLIFSMAERVREGRDGKDRIKHKLFFNSEELYPVFFLTEKSGTQY